MTYVPQPPTPNGYEAPAAPPDSSVVLAMAGIDPTGIIMVGLGILLVAFALLVIVLVHMSVKHRDALDSRGPQYRRKGATR